MFVVILLLYQGVVVAADAIQIVLPFDDVTLIPGRMVRLRAVPHTYFTLKIVTLRISFAGS